MLGDYNQISGAMTETGKICMEGQILGLALVLQLLQSLAIGQQFHYFEFKQIDVFRGTSQ